MVDRTGFEPVTSSMPWKRATNYANGPGYSELYYKHIVPAAQEAAKKGPGGAAFAAQKNTITYRGSK